jgi:hypothetical protein
MRTLSGPALLLACIGPIALSPDAAAATDGACTLTASAALSSCRHETEGDYWIGVGVCQNLKSATGRSKCLEDADAERADAREECQDQHASRLEVCAVLGEAPYAPKINPDEFVDPAQIGRSVAPNPFFPLNPGRKVVLRSSEERIETTVTGETTRILGVRCAAVRDVGIEDGEITEDTIDWFAQDIYGNVWYFGEISQELQDGVLVGIEGSWKAGVDGAKPGIVMEAAPQAGDVYRQEFALGNAEDLGKVLRLDGTATTPAASCRGDCLVIRDFSPMEPDGARENKYYARGVGLIMESNLDSGEKVKLIEIDE